MKSMAWVMAGALLVGAPRTWAGPGALEAASPIELGNRLLLVMPDPQPREIEVDVDPSGQIPLGRYGKIKVAGLTVKSAEAAVRETLGRFIRNTTAVTLVRIDQKHLVFVTGQVAKPGWVRVEPGATVWEAMQAAGVDKAGADLARVTLARNGKEREVNVRAFLTEHAEMPELLVGDTLFVPANDAQAGAGGGVARVTFLDEQALQDKVFVIGAVRNPGLFERSDVLTPLTAIGLAGGPSGDADLASVRVLTRDRSEIVNLAALLLGRPGDTLTIPKGGAGAIVFVPSRPQGTVDPLSQQIQVIGGVTSPGTKVVTGPLALLDAISAAGGPTAEGDLTEVTVVRNGPGYSLVTAYDVERFLSKGGLVGQVYVRPGDTIHVGRPSFETWNNVLKFVSDVAIISAAVVIFVSLVQDDTGNQAAAVNAGGTAGATGAQP